MGKTYGANKSIAEAKQYAQQYADRDGVEWVVWSAKGTEFAAVIGSIYDKPKEAQTKICTVYPGGKQTVSPEYDIAGFDDRLTAVEERFDLIAEDLVRFHEYCVQNGIECSANSQTSTDIEREENV